jgi:methyltransferase (TIGR00027 family)
MAAGDQPLIRDISDTALWAAVFRARENMRSDGLFRDPLADRLAGERGHQIAAMAHGSDNEWAWAMRTYLFDLMIQHQVAAGADMVINLAAGLDARPYRMALPSSLQWVEVDLPRMIAYKEEVLAGETPVCRLERRAVDLSDAARRREMLAELGGRAGRILVLSEGLLIYLGVENVSALARDMAATPGMHAWTIDVVSPGLLAMLQQTTGRATGEAGAPLLFGPAEGPAFFTPLGWRAEEVRSVFAAAVETDRLPPELQPYKHYPDPKPPFAGPEVWSGVCTLVRA